MTPPRFQFTIRGLLWATFWAAVSAAAFYDARAPGHGLNYGYTYGPYLEALRALVAVACLCPAVGAIMNKHVKGMQFGLVVIGSCLTWAAALKFGGIYPFPIPWR